MEREIVRVSCLDKFCVKGNYKFDFWKYRCNGFCPKFDFWRKVGMRKMEKENFSFVFNICRYASSELLKKIIICADNGGSIIEMNSDDFISSSVRRFILDWAIICGRKDVIEDLREQIGSFRSGAIYSATYGRKIVLWMAEIGDDECGSEYAGIIDENGNFIVVDFGPDYNGIMPVEWKDEWYNVDGVFVPENVLYMSD